MKEIPNTKLLVSLHHNCHKLANMAVFDISKKDQIKEIYSLGEVSGGSIINYEISQKPTVNKPLIFSRKKEAIMESIRIFNLN